MEKDITQDKIVGDYTGVDKPADIDFSPDQKKLVQKIQQVHDSCKSKNNKFENTYREALLLIRDKATPLWYEGVANQLVDILEYCRDEFFESFDVPDEKADHVKYTKFDEEKKKINDFNEIIQSIKHKRRENVNKLFRGEYHDKIGLDITLTNDNYEQIFKGFETTLVNLFEYWDLKI